jgi:hypothetical protein
LSRRAFLGVYDLEILAVPEVSNLFASFDALAKRLEASVRYLLFSSLEN